MPRPVTRLARTLLASVFVNGGINQLRAPDAIGGLVEQSASGYGIAQMPVDGTDLVRANGAGMLAAGSTLALGIAPRLSALALLGMLVPTTLVGHPFWTVTDERERAEQRNHALANAAICGGLLLVVLDRD